MNSPLCTGLDVRALLLVRELAGEELAERVEEVVEARTEAGTPRRVGARRLIAAGILPGPEVGAGREVLNEVQPRAAVNGLELELR